MNKAYKESMDNYIKGRFSVGIEPYMRSLRKHGIVDKKNILDVGCGPGEWAFAAAKLNHSAQIVGIDINEMEIQFAIKYAKEHGFNDCKFQKESYEELLRLFKPESFDVIMCNSVIMFIDMKRAFSIMSILLKSGGILLMFYNHGCGYYVHKIVEGAKKLDFKSMRYGAIVLYRTIGGFISNKSSKEYFVTFKYLRKIANNYGIVLSEIETEPKLDYKDSYLGVPYVFSLKGVKK